MPLPIDGTILKMEFLHPPENDLGQIILLFVVSKNRRSKLVWYQWNDRNTLHQSHITPTAQGLPQDQQLPLLLIPLTMLTAFMLVRETQILVYRNILTGTPNRFLHHLSAVQDPEEPGSSKRDPVWVSWARPMRSKRAAYRFSKDCIFLFREDGIVQLLDIDIDVDHIVDTKHSAGKLRTNIDTSIAILDLGSKKVDLLVAGGDMSDGGIWRLGPRKDPEYIANISNWTPLNDFVPSNAPLERRKKIGNGAMTNDIGKGQQRIFACTGRGKHGAISELRYGVQASLKSSTIEIGDLVKSGVMAIWALQGSFKVPPQQVTEQRTDDIIYVLFSHPTRTSVLRVWRSTIGEIQQEDRPDLIHTDIGLDLDARTIAVGMIREGLTIQVTETSIRAMSLPAGKDEESSLNYVYHFADARVVAACVHSPSERSFILAAIQKEENYYLQLGQYNAGYKLLTEPLRLHSHPSCVSLQTLENRVLALVGTVAGTLQIFIADDFGSNLHKAGEYTFNGPFAICDSVAMLTSIREGEMSSRHLIVCGLRNGSVQTLYMNGAGFSWHLDLFEELIIGHTSVKVTTDVTKRDRAIIHCEETMCTLEYPKPKFAQAPAIVSNIWITDPGEPALQHGYLSAITQFVDPWLPRDNPGLAAGSLVCVSGESLHFVDLNLQPQMVPRSLQIAGSPIRVIYSKQLDKLVVLHTKLTIQRSRTSNELYSQIGQRSLEPRIGFLEPNSEDLMITNQRENDEIMASERKPGEKFLGITEWFPRIHEKVYHMLVVNTMLSRASKPVGRLLFFALGPNIGHCPKLTVKKRLELEAPVYCVTPYPEKSLIYSCGDDLCMQTLVADHFGIKWQPPIKAAMRSPARHLTIAEPHIYVSSTRESLSVFRYEDDKIVYQFGDQSARNGMHHVNLPEQSLVLASNMNSTVVGLWYPPQRRIDNAMTTVFEAVLPGSITRFQYITRPVWYRDASSNDGNQARTHLPAQGDEAIIGSSADGTITQFDILDKGWRLLRFIQNMAERNPIICPFVTFDPFKRHIEPSTTRPHHMHINGDILQRMLERGGEDLLREMLDKEPDPERRYTDFDTAEARWARFRELAMEVVDMEGEAWLERVLLWIRCRLRNPL